MAPSRTSIVALALIASALSMFLPACSGAGNKPTPSDCDAIYSTAAVGCDAIYPDPDTKEHRQCVAIATAAKLACLIASSPEPAPTPAPSPSPAGGPTTMAIMSSSPRETRADRWARAMPWLRDGDMTPDAFEAYVTSGP